jgi:hypothetical protein
VWETAGADFESVAKYWLLNKKFKCLNALTTAVFWTIWKFRNEMCFQGRKWSGVKELIGRCARILKDWMLLLKPEDVLVMGAWVEKLEMEQARPPSLPWDPGALVARDKELSDAGVIRDAVRPDMELGADTLLVSMKNEPTTECNRARHGLSVTNFVSLGTET